MRPVRYNVAASLDGYIALDIVGAHRLIFRSPLPVVAATLTLRAVHS